MYLSLWRSSKPRLFDWNLITIDKNNATWKKVEVIVHINDYVYTDEYFNMFPQFYDEDWRCRELGIWSQMRIDFVEFDRYSCLLDNICLLVTPTNEGN